MENNDKFIVLSHSLIRNKLMTMQEKIIYMEILNLSSTEKGCFASNSHFEVSFGITKKSVSNTINSLVRKGLIISKISDRNHKRILSIKNGGVSIKDGQVSIKSGESKDNKTYNKTFNKLRGIILKFDYSEKLNIELIKFLDYRKSKKKPITTELEIETFLKKLNRLADNDKDKIEILENSIANGWQGIFKLNGDKSGKFRANGEEASTAIQGKSRKERLLGCGN